MRDSTRTTAWLALGVGGVVTAIGAGLHIFDKPTPAPAAPSGLEQAPALKRFDIGAREPRQTVRVLPWATLQGGRATLSGEW